MSDEPMKAPTERLAMAWSALLPAARFGVVLAPWAWFLVRWLHPWMELIAILLPILVAASVLALVVVAAYRRSLLVLAVAMSFVAFYLVAVFVPGRPTSLDAPTDTTRFASINLAEQWFSDNEVGFYVFDREPDVFVGIELREPVDLELRRRYDNGISELLDYVPESQAVPLEDTESYRREGYPSIGLYSNREIERLDDPIAAQIPGGLPGFRAAIRSEAGDYVVYALHIPRPGNSSGVFEISLSEQRELIDAILDAIEAETLPVVVLGDLNVVDRGESYQRLTDSLTDAMRVDRWAGPTRTGGFWYSALRLRIDHLLVSEGLCVEDATAPSVIYTDHSAIQADVGPCPAGLAP